MVRYWPFGSTSVSQLSADDLQSLVDNAVQEGLFLEFKSAWTPDKLARAVASFANNPGGGTIILGVEAEGLTATDIVGVELGGDLAESAVQIIRSNIDPVPDYRLSSVEVSAERSCLVIQVEEGTNPPYLYVPKGQVLIRTPTSSEPIRLTDRAAIDRLFERGRRGLEWARKNAVELLPREMPIEERAVQVWTVPTVENGLGHHELIFRESFMDRVYDILPVPAVSFGAEPRYSMASDSSAVNRTAFSIMTTTTVHVSGIIHTRWGRVADRDHDMTFPDFEGLLRAALPKHGFITEELLGHRGSVAIAAAGRVAHTLDQNSYVRLWRDPVPVQALAEEETAKGIYRSLAREVGAYEYEPEPGE